MTDARFGAFHCAREPRTQLAWNADRPHRGVGGHLGFGELVGGDSRVRGCEHRRAGANYIDARAGRGRGAEQRVQLSRAVGGARGRRHSLRTCGTGPGQPSAPLVPPPTPQTHSTPDVGLCRSPGCRCGCFRGRGCNWQLPKKPCQRCQPLDSRADAFSFCSQIFFLISPHGWEEVCILLFISKETNKDTLRCSGFLFHTQGLFLTVLGDQTG